MQVLLGNKSCPYFWSPSSQVSEMALYKEKESRFGCFEDKLPFIAQVSAAPRQPHAARAPAVQEHGRVWASGMVRMFWFLLLTAHKEVRKHPDYIAALLP